MSTDPVPHVSIIVPAFNAERYIGTCLASVFGQTYRDYELIVVDDGSTDQTREAIVAAGGPVRYISQPNQGPAAARNSGIAAARGELVCFLDADDSWFPDKLEHQVEFLTRHRDVGLLFADEEEFDDQGVHCHSLVSTSRFFPAIAAGGTLDGAFQKLLEENFIPTSTVMIRKACFEACGQFDVTLKGPEDRDMWSRIAVRFPVAFIPRVLARKRVVASSVSRDIETTLRSRIRMWIKARRLFPDLVSRAAVNALLAPTYLQLGFVLLEKGRSPEARTMALKSLVSRPSRSWLLAVSLVIFTWVGRTFTALAFDAKRRLFPSR
jgi:glycosyltransferase involved in cell wall biosynthesis